MAQHPWVASGKQLRSFLVPWTPTSHTWEGRTRWKSTMILQPHMLQTKRPFSCYKQIKVHQVGSANLMMIFPTRTHMSIFLLLNMHPLIHEKSITMFKNCRKDSVALVSSAHVPLGSSRQLTVHMANTKACHNGSCPEWKSELSPRFRLMFLLIIIIEHWGRSLFPNLGDSLTRQVWPTSENFIT